MCGINGILSFSNSGGEQSLLRRMNMCISHRGPDSSGIWSESLCNFGHVRLSIIDLSSRSDQPLVKDGLAIIFNGEIYNYRELKAEFSADVFVTESDTEVVLELWRKYGSGCLDKLRGMFSFAIYDSASAETVLVRDRFGIKPLFYSRFDDKFVFSSELKAVESVLPSQPALDRGSLLASMLYVWIPEDSCIWKGCFKVKPGEILRIDSDGVVKSEIYWSSKSLIKDDVNIFKESDAIEYLSDAIEDSVRAHLVADVPVSAFLSGGLDSSLIVAMAKKYTDNLDCYTIRFSENDKKHEAMADDAFFAQKVADHFGVNLHTIDVSPDLTSLLPKIVKHLDEPIGDSAAINTFLICQAASDAGVKVLLSGMGADEIFAGYRKHYANCLAAQYRNLPAFLRRSIHFALEHMPVGSREKGHKLVRWAKRFDSFANLPSKDAFFRSYTYFDYEEIYKAFEADVRSDFDAIVKSHHSIFDYGNSSRGLVDAMCYTDLNMFMVSLNLAYTDRASMAASTEVRVPFIDLDVISAAFNVDSSLKLKGRTQKYVLKKVAEKWLPKEIIYRPKVSFTMPLRGWIKNDLNGFVKEFLLGPGGLADRGLLRRKFISDLIDDEILGRSDNAQKIWHLLTLEQWFRNHEF